MEILELSANKIKQLSSDGAVGKEQEITSSIHALHQGFSKGNGITLYQEDEDHRDIRTKTRWVK